MNRVVWDATSGLWRDTGKADPVSGELGGGGAAIDLDTLSISRREYQRQHPVWRVKMKSGVQHEWEAPWLDDEDAVLELIAADGIVTLWAGQRDSEGEISFQDLTAEQCRVLAEQLLKAAECLDGNNQG